MDKQIIFEDEQIRVIFLKGNSKELIFSFGDLITRAKGLSINAEKSLAKYEYNVIGVMPKQKSWFPSTSMAEMMSAVQPILDQFETVIGYGGSMGGYAAIKYSKLLKMNRIIAFVPQYSIDPQQVEDRRYAEFFDVALHRDMQIEADDVLPNSEYIIVYDPYYAEDREHYLKIKSKLKHVHTLHLPFTGHEALSVLASSSLLNDFIRHPWDKNYFYQEMRRVKKNSKFYYRTVVRNLLTRHSAALGRILRSNQMQLDDQYFDASLKQMITRIMLSKRQVTEQDLQKLGIKVNLPVDTTRAQLQDHYGNFLVFNLISHKIESYSQDAIQLNHKYLVPLLTKATCIVKVELNNERYMIAMNDRHVMKLVKEDDALSSDMSPIIIKKHAEYYVLSYKQQNLHSDDLGLCYFVDPPVKDQQQFIIA
ncbi:hypothetical protein [Acinetobacter sp. MD2(2019)]|uniref:hypothetical protein n=1 Tax=Acinetobacter sp. MD2(2019) TaxID=2605273 RepID=UPI002D1F47ED|nr:hypothetical protein [Acinetobacter sp. MD2(2019)]MEB3753277.1 hypothetical protein [Acinetobacter sp. MD2(2019)]